VKEMIKSYELFVLLLTLFIVSSFASDKGGNSYSSGGDIQQVEYAKNAGMKGSTVICCSSKNGEVILCLPNENIQSQKLMDRRSTDKIAKVDNFVWSAFSGLAGDGKSLIKQARQFCIEFNSKFGTSPSVETIARYIGEIQHESTLNLGINKKILYFI
jgi:20S proteasome alpha/beta subunit